MKKQPFLAWFVVIWRDEERAINTEFLGYLSIGYGMLRGVGTSAREDQATFFRGCHRKTDKLLTFLM